MVSRIIKIGTLLLVVLSFSSCIWFYGIFSEDIDYDTHQMKFSLKNLTGEQIVIKSNFSLNCSNCYSFETKLHSMTIDPDSTVIIYTNNGSSFDRFGKTGNNYDTVFIYSNDNVLLKTWAEQDKNKEGVQFFNESNWTKKSWEDEPYVYTEYTFELTPEDIQK